MSEVNHVVLVNGNIGTGKTTVSEYLEDFLEYDRFSKDDIRRELGQKRYDVKNTVDVLKKLDRRVSSSLKKGRGIVIDSTYKTGNGRKHVYDRASAYRRPVVVVECVCPEDVAKHRISQRKEDDLHSPPADPAVYDRIKGEWEDVIGDFRDGRNSHVSHVRYDSHFGETELVILRRGSVDFVDYLADALEGMSFMDWGLRMGLSLG